MAANCPVRVQEVIKSISAILTLRSLKELLIIVIVFWLEHLQLLCSFHFPYLRTGEVNNLFQLAVNSIRLKD